MTQNEFYNFIISNYFYSLENVIMQFLMFYRIIDKYMMNEYFS